MTTARGCFIGAGLYAWPARARRAWRQNGNDARRSRNGGHSEPRPDRPGRSEPRGAAPPRGGLPARRARRPAARWAPHAPIPAATAARTLWVRDLDLDRATVEALAVEHADGFLGVLVGGHLDEPEPPRLPGVPIRDDRGRLH